MPENPEDLQSLLNIVSNWCEKWRLSINNKKTQIMHVRKCRKNISDFNFYYGKNYGTKEFPIPSNNCVLLEYTTTYKYLGVLFYGNMDFSVLADDLATRASRALGSLIAKFYANNGMGYRSYKKLYNACITKIADYSSGVWGLGLYPKLNNVHHRALRTYLGVHKYAPIEALTGELAFTPPAIRRKVEMVRLWNRLVKLPENRLPRIVFNHEYENLTNWCRDLRSIFEQTNFMHIFENKITVDPLDVKKKLLEIFSTNFIDSLLLKPKLRNYALFKFSFECEPYNWAYLSRNKRSIFAQLRMGILPLRIETGRFQNLDLNNRTCFYCNSQQVEDEYHFIFQCTHFDHLRTPFLAKCSEMDENFDTMDEVEKLRYVLSNEKIQTITADFAQEAFLFIKKTRLEILDFGPPLSFFFATCTLS